MTRKTDAEHLALGLRIQELIVEIREGTTNDVDDLLILCLHEFIRRHDVDMLRRLLAKADGDGEVIGETRAVLDEMKSRTTGPGAAETSSLSWLR